MKNTNIDYEVCCDIPEGKEVYYYFYKIENLINGKFYYGVHKTKSLSDGYPGSGYALKRDIKLLGIEKFKKYITKFFNSEKEMYLYEEKMITKEVINDENCYNIKLGGYGGWDTSIGCVTVRDENNNCFRVAKNDERFLSGELKHNMVGRVNVIDESGNHIQISKTEFENNKDKYKSHTSNKVIIKLPNGKKQWIDKSTFDAGNFKGSTYGFGVFKDKDGNGIMLKIDDPRVLSGEYVGYTQGKTIFKCKDDFSKTLFLDKDDPRVLSGEYVGINYGMITAYDKNGNKIRVSKYDERLKTGELINSTLYWNKKKRGEI